MNPSGSAIFNEALMFNVGDKVVMKRPGNSNADYIERQNQVGIVVGRRVSVGGNRLVAVQFADLRILECFADRFDLVSHSGYSIQFDNVDDAIKAAEILSPIFNRPIEVRSQ